MKKIFLLFVFVCFVVSACGPKNQRAKTPEPKPSATESSGLSTAVEQVQLNVEVRLQSQAVAKIQSGELIPATVFSQFLSSDPKINIFEEQESHRVDVKFLHTESPEEGVVSLSDLGKDKVLKTKGVTSIKLEKVDQPIEIQLGGKEGIKSDYWVSEGSGKISLASAAFVVPCDDSDKEELSYGKVLSLLQIKKEDDKSVFEPGCVWRVKHDKANCSLKVETEDKTKTVSFTIEENKIVMDSNQLKQLPQANKYSGWIQCETRQKVSLPPTRVIQVHGTTITELGEGVVVE